MIKREDPSPLRDGYPYILLTLDRGAHQMKLPSHLWCAKLLKATKEVHITALVAMQGDRTPASIMTATKNAGPEALCILGALIGKAWAHQEQALEAVEADGLLTFGEAVYEELHDAGYSLDEFCAIGLTLVSAIWERSQFTDEVSQRASFFSQLMAPESLNGSTLASAT